MLILSTEDKKGIILQSCRWFFNPKISNAPFAISSCGIDKVLFLLLLNLTHNSTENWLSFKMTSWEEKILKVKNLNQISWFGFHLLVAVLLSYFQQKLARRLQRNQRTSARWPYQPRTVAPPWFCSRRQKQVSCLLMFKFYSPVVLGAFFLLVSNFCQQRVAVT